MLWQEWWVWIFAGIVLAVFEVIAPGYIMLGFAAGAISTGLLLAIGVGSNSLPILILLWAVFSLIWWGAIRKIFGGQSGNVKIIEDDINEG